MIGWLSVALPEYTIGTVLKRSSCFRAAFRTTRNSLNLLSSIENWVTKSTGVPPMPLEITTPGDGFQNIAPSSMW